MEHEMTDLVPIERASVQLAPVMTASVAMARLKEFQTFIGEYLTESKDGGNDGGDYGLLPGTNKRVLFRSGVDKLAEVYGLYDEYDVITMVENFESGLFDYTLRCRLRSRRDDSLVGTGVGSCSSYESKYRWRPGQRLCPTCGADAIRKSKDDGGYYCWAKIGGCGAKFVAGDPAIVHQSLARVQNPDLADAKNTVLKMAKKRAKSDAVIGATRSASIFTQDLEDFDHAPSAPAKHVEVIEGQWTKDAPDVSAEARNAATRPRAAAAPILPHGVKPMTKAVVPSAPAVARDSGAVTVPVKPMPTTVADVVCLKGETAGRKWSKYTVTFTGKVLATDGGVTTSAVTFDDDLAISIENVRDAKKLVYPVVAPGRKANTYDLKGIDFPVEA